MKKRFILFLWISVVSSACPRGIFPCKCKPAKINSEVTCSGLETIKDLKKILENLKNEPIEYFLLNKSKFKEVPVEIFSGNTITTLNVSNSKFQALVGTKPIFSGLENSLKNLTLYNCFDTSTIKSITFNHLKELKILSLTKNRIDIIENDWFDSGPYGLEELTIESTGGTILGSRAFFSLINLKEIYLDDMKLSSVQRKMFPIPAKYLKLLRMSHNEIEVLPRDIFSDMPKLEDVYLDNNAMKTMPMDTWSPVWKQLDIVFVTGNPLVCDSAIKWIFQIEKNHTLEGSCDSPPNLRHKYLSLLTINDFE
ncbi:leucine-rich repeat-containing protein 4C-like [Centruroides sculpturatus]|uniref:leucine-rich repeat-containing protein 4C-like n=1 Tax=Centruroides sculpturatus TaxID=218467 RepID=UPI000C6CA4F5|nr:leucine-rich repeat-containing protein 4C-like [Centruroides sculpturatus]